MPLNSAPLDDPTASLVSPAWSNAQPIYSPLKLGVLASGSGSNFAAITQAIQSGDLKAQVQVLIYNNPGAKAAARAEAWGIPTKLLNHRDFPQRQELDRQIAQTLQAFEVEWVVMAGWMRRVTVVLIESYKNRMLNIHPSLLPSFPGVGAVEQALAHGVKISGCTVHLVELEVDSGPIIQQAAVPVLADDTPQTLHARIQEQEHRIFPQAIAWAARQAAEQKEPV